MLFICTGNASRSVIAGAALRAKRPDLIVQTAGTLVIDGLPMSNRTRAAFTSVGLDVPQHSSRQATPDLLAAAGLIVAAAPEHVAWVARQQPDVLAKTATLIHLVDELKPSTAGSLASRIVALDLAAHRPTPEEEIVDPGGGEVDGYIAVANQISALIDELAIRL